MPRASAEGLHTAPEPDPLAEAQVVAEAGVVVEAEEVAESAEAAAELEILADEGAVPETDGVDVWALVHRAATDTS